MATEPENPRIRIVIPVYNPPESLSETLALVAQRVPGGINAIILVDDRSTNGAISCIRMAHPALKILGGDGNLWWCGGMRLGMEAALEENADVVVWLNHDCMPDPGTIQKLANKAAQAGMGAISAWCYCEGDNAFPVNPGFRDFQEIPVAGLIAGGFVRTDGVNGNCVAISAAAIRDVGLPDAKRHPHYGDGPYTWRLHRAGYTVGVLPEARAALVREFERCVDEADHSSLWHAPLTEKIGYYLFSMRSKFHLANKFRDLQVFRGRFRALWYLPFSEARLILNVLNGHFRLKRSSEEKISEILARYRGRFPEKELRASLEKLDGKSHGEPRQTPSQ